MAEDYMQLYQKALAGLETGGKKLEASLAEIEEGKRQATARGQQALVSGGLSGTTRAGGVPIQAEKIAARQRLGARGQAEQTYLTTLASFAAFAQRGEETQKQREFTAEQAGIQREFESQQAELGRFAATGTTQYEKPAAQQSSLAEFMRGFDVRGEGGAPTGGSQAQQFPSLYDQQPTATPDWMSGGGGGVSGVVRPGARQYDLPDAGAEPSTGFTPYGSRTAPTIEDKPWPPTAGQTAGRTISGFERWTKERGMGRTASTMMQYERAGKPYG